MSETGIDLLCIGNALVDIFAGDGNDIHLRYGIAKPAQHVEIEKIESILPQLSVSTMVSGGGAANVAKIAGFLGAKTCFTGAIGNDVAPDHFGQLFKNDLAAAGVKLALHQKPFPTGLCLLLKASDGKTRIAAAPSAALKLSEDDINADDIKNAKLVVIDGFILDRPSLVSHILRLAAQFGKIAAIDLSSPFIAKERAKEIAEYARKYPLILFMNEEEAEAFYNLTFEALLQYLSGETPRAKKNGEFPIIVVKLGSRGAIYYAGEEICKAETQAIIPIETTGAGDAFCAGFLAAWVQNKPLSECAMMGNKAAALVLGAEGTRLNYFDSRL
jgi:sugar/nucleoside kinase (ribokinase family)